MVINVNAYVCTLILLFFTKRNKIIQKITLFLLIEKGLLSVP